MNAPTGHPDIEATPPVPTGGDRNAWTTAGKPAAIVHPLAGHAITAVMADLLRTTTERDQARALAAQLEAENAELRRLGRLAFFAPVRYQDLAERVEAWVRLRCHADTGSLDPDLIGGAA